MRSIGTSFFISISVAEVVRASGANYSRMTEMISPFNKTLGLPVGDGRLVDGERRRAGRDRSRRSTSRRP